MISRTALYKAVPQQETMSAGGVVLVGQMPADGCTAGTCSYDGGRGLVGDLQNVRIWSRLLSSSDVLHGIRWPFAGSTAGLLLYWRFATSTTNQYMSDTGLSVTDISGQAGSIKAAGHTGVLSPAGARIVDDTPSLNPNLPCGKVYENTWHFAAPSKFRGDLSSAYGGRLQFSLYSPSHNGRARNTRGAVALFGSGIELSFPLPLFELPSSSGWSSYSAILREDFGWVVEPAGTPASTLAMRAVLKNVSSLLIRGDGWVYDQSGPGQEVMYLNAVKLIGAST